MVWSATVLNTRFMLSGKLTWLKEGVSNPDTWMQIQGTTQRRDKTIAKRAGSSAMIAEVALEVRLESVAACAGSKHYLPSASRSLRAACARLRHPVAPTVLLLRKGSMLTYDIKKGAGAALPSDDRLNRHDFAAIASDGILYIFGGGGIPGVIPDASVAKFDLQARIWAQMPPMPTGRRGAAAAKAGQSVYVIGGRVGLGNTTSNVVEMLDLESEEWTPVPHLQSSRAYCAAVVASTSIYVLGGGGLTSIEKLDLCEPYMWEQLLLLMPMWRDVGFAAVTVANEIYVFGGWQQDSRDCARWSAGLWTSSPASCSGLKLDLDGLVWTQLPDMPANHEYFGQAVEIDGSIYLFGGSTDGAVSKFEPWTDTWKRLPGIGVDSHGGGCYAACVLPSKLDVGDVGDDRGDDGGDASSQPLRLPDRGIPIEQVQRLEPPAAIFGEETEQIAASALGRRWPTATPSLGTVTSLDLCCLCPTCFGANQPYIMFRHKRSFSLITKLQGRPCKAPRSRDITWRSPV